MKTFIATAAAVATLAGAAYAAGPSEGTLSQIRSYAPYADLSGLTNAEAQNILTIIHGGDSDGEKRTRVNAALQ